MKKVLLIFALNLPVIMGFSQEVNPQYDEALADSLGADDYGMKMYILVILKTGTKTVEDEAERNTLFRGHLDNIGRLAEEGKLVVAGPLQKNENEYRGIFIMNVPTIAEAENLMGTDPAIASGMLATEFYGWYGSAALPVYLETHSKIEKKRP